MFRPPKKRKRAYKKFESCSDKQKGRRTKRIFDQMVKECEQQNMEFSTFLGYLGRRYYSNSLSSHFDKEKEDMYNDIYKGKNPFKHYHLSGRA